MPSPFGSAGRESLMRLASFARTVPAHLLKIPESVSPRLTACVSPKREELDLILTARNRQPHSGGLVVDQ